MWYKELINSSVHNIDIILLGNKIDLDYQREVSTEEGENLKKKLNLKKFVECSAKNGFNVPGIFIEAAKILYDKYFFNHSDGEDLAINYYSGCGNSNLDSSRCCAETSTLSMKQINKGICC